MADPIARIMKTIEECTDARKLRQIAINAREKGELAVARAAELRMYAILPSEAPGTLEYEIWQSIHALEGTLTNERGKTTRLARTRQKIKKVGELATVRDLVLSSKPSEGFSMLIDRDMAFLTFEHVALRHPDRFEGNVLEAASARLQSVGIGLPA
jgi:hypothetical protein